MSDPIEVLVSNYQESLSLVRSISELENRAREFKTSVTANLVALPFCLFAIVWSLAVHDPLWTTLVFAGFAGTLVGITIMGSRLRKKALRYAGALRQRLHDLGVEWN